MPNRLIRDWTMSDKVNALTVQAERFFTRLIMKVDDYGCFHADSRLLKANLFPLLLDAIREADLLRWMAECQKAGLIVLYESESKKYVQILDFRQRLDRAKSKYPLPTANDPQRLGGQVPPEVEVELEVEREVEQKPAHPLGKKIVTPLKTENKEHSPGAEKWTTWPAETYLTLPLPEIKVGSVIELFKITKNTDVTAAQVRGLWNIFKTQYFTGKKFYQDVSDTYSHFINWCKTQNISKNETDRGSNGRIDKNTGAQQLLSSVRDQHNSGRG